MGTNGSTTALAPSNGTAAHANAEALLARLEDPQTAAALNHLLDNIGLLSLLVGSLDELFRRGDELTGNVSALVGELRTGFGPDGADMGTTARQLGTLIPALAEAAPAVQTVVRSGIVDPEPLGILSSAAQSLVDGLHAAETHGKPMGAFGLAKAMRHPDVQRGIGYILEVAKAFGKRLPG